VLAEKYCILQYSCFCCGMSQHAIYLRSNVEPMLKRLQQLWGSCRARNILPPQYSASKV